VPVLAGFLVASQLVPYIGVFPLGTLFPLLVSQVARRPLPVLAISAGAGREEESAAVPRPVSVAEQRPT
jgi:hypothetical protein